MLRWLNYGMGDADLCEGAPELELMNGSCMDEAGMNIAVEYEGPAEKRRKTAAKKDEERRRRERMEEELRQSVVFLLE